MSNLESIPSTSTSTSSAYPLRSFFAAKKEFKVNSTGAFKTGGRGSKDKNSKKWKEREKAPPSQSGAQAGAQAGAQSPSPAQSLIVTNFVKNARAAKGCEEARLMCELGCNSKRTRQRFIYTGIISGEELTPENYALRYSLMLKHRLQDGVLFDCVSLFNMSSKLAKVTTGTVGLGLLREIIEPPDKVGHVLPTYFEECVSLSARRYGRYKKFTTHMEENVLTVVKVVSGSNSLARPSSNLVICDTSLLPHPVSIETSGTTAICMVFLTGVEDETKEFVRGLVGVGGRYESVTIVFCVTGANVSGTNSTSQVNSIVNLGLPQNGLGCSVAFRFADVGSIVGVIENIVSADNDRQGLPQNEGGGWRQFYESEWEGKVAFLMGLAPSLSVLGGMELLREHGGRVMDVLDVARGGWGGEGGGEGGVRGRWRRQISECVELSVIE